MKDKQEKTALVTGSSRGIGRQIALTLAEKEYNVVVNYHNASSKGSAEEVCVQIRSMGRKSEAICANIGDLKSLRAMYDKIDRDFPSLDLVVNNAGSSDEVYFLEATEADFDKITLTDWKGLYFSAQFAAKRMIRNKVKGGVIVNLSSNQVLGCWPRATIYAATKAAVSKFTKNAAMELAPYGIRMVAVAPGYTDVGWAPEDHRRDAAKLLPLRRFASTKEIAEAVAFLAGPNAGYITGTTLTIDGGATLPVVACNDFVESKPKNV